VSCLESTVACFLFDSNSIFFEQLNHPLRLFASEDVGALFLIEMAIAAMFLQI
jgi:hypothetical protein